MASTTPSPPGVSPSEATAVPAAQASSSPCHGTSPPTARIARARQAASATQLSTASRAATHSVGGSGFSAVTSSSCSCTISSGSPSGYPLTFCAPASRRVPSRSSSCRGPGRRSESSSRPIGTAPPRTPTAADTTANPEPDSTAPTATTATRANDENTPETASAQPATAASAPSATKRRIAKSVAAAGPASGRPTEMALPA